MQIPELRTARLLLRPPRPADAARILEIYGDPETRRHWNGPDDRLEQSQARVARMGGHWQRHGYGDWVLEESSSKAVLGYCGLHHISSMSEVNLGFLIDRAFWGRGLATEAGAACLEFGFRTAGLGVIVGTAAPANAGAIRVLKKLGMTYWKEIQRNGPRAVYRLKRVPV